MGEQVVNYRKYGEGGLAKTDEEFVTLVENSPRAIGSDWFKAWVDKEYLKLKELLA